MLSPCSCHWDVVPAGQRCSCCWMGACVSPGTQEKCGMGKPGAREAEVEKQAELGNFHLST